MSNDPAERRGFLLGLAGLFASLPILGGLFAALRTGLSPAAVDAPSRLALCRLGEVPQTGILPRVVAYEVRRGGQVESVSEVVMLTREQGQVIALSARCTHLGCPVHVDAESPDAPFVCPCHEGRFDATGQVLSGPPTQPLQRLLLELPDNEDGTIHLIRGEE